MPTVTPAGDQAELIEFDADVSAAELHTHAAEIRSPCIVGARSLYVIHGGGEAARLSGQARAPVLHTIDVNFIDDWRKADGLRLAARYLGFRAGFAYLEPKRHISHVHELDGDEVNTFGPALAKCTKALKEATNAEVAYIYIFGDGIPHLHLHLFPRKRDDPFVGRPIDPRLSTVHRSEAEIAALAGAIIQRLEGT